MQVNQCQRVVAMTSSKTIAYVANGEEALAFDDNELLNQKDEHPFEDPPWRVIDSDLHFEPMVVRDTPKLEAPEAVFDDTNKSDNFTPELTEDDGMTEEKEETEETEQNEAIEDAEEGPEANAKEDSNPLESQLIRISEEEVEKRIDQAVQESNAILKAEFQTKIEALESVVAETDAKIDQARNEAQLEYETKLESASATYSALAARLVSASENVSEFFEPLSELAVHIGMQLVRGELTVGPIAITRLVQGCLDQLESYQPKNTPILKMHPRDLEMYLSGIDGEPEGIQMRPDSGMARGDVSLQMDDTTIDDLVNTRLEVLANHIFGLKKAFSDDVFRRPLETVSTIEESFNEIEKSIETGGSETSFEDNLDKAKIPKGEVDEESNAKSISDNSDSVAIDEVGLVLEPSSEKIVNSSDIESQPDGSVDTKDID